MSHRESLPGFFFNVEKWFGSVAAQRMSFSEKGVYLSMLFKQWLSRTRNLPDSPEAIADLIAITDQQVAEVVAAWPSVRRKFVVSKHAPDRIYNVEVENTRRKQRANELKKSAAGKAAGKASAAKRKAEQQLDVNVRSTTVEQSSTEKRREEGIREEKRGEEVPTARSKRPIFTGQRLTVFEWQFDNCTKILGPFTNDFDLHGFFADLDERATRINLVIPRRDGGQWLEARLMEEIQSRGLPIAQTPRAGKLTTNLAAALQNIQAVGE